MKFKKIKLKIKLKVKFRLSSLAASLPHGFGSPPNKRQLNEPIKGQWPVSG